MVDTAPAVPDTAEPADTPTRRPPLPSSRSPSTTTCCTSHRPRRCSRTSRTKRAGPVRSTRLTWEFFAADGTVLSQVTDQATAKVTLEPDPEATPPTDLDRQLLLDRIDAFLARVQVQLDRDLQTGMVAEHRRVPRLSGELPDVVAGLAAVLQVPVTITQPDSRNWVHNLGHRLRGR